MQAVFHRRAVHRSDHLAGGARGDVVVSEWPKGVAAAHAASLDQYSPAERPNLPEVAATEPLLAALELGSVGPRSATDRPGNGLQLGFGPVAATGIAAVAFVVGQIEPFRIGFLEAE